MHYYLHVHLIKELNSTFISNFLKLLSNITFMYLYFPYLHIVPFHNTRMRFALAIVASLHQFSFHLLLFSPFSVLPFCIFFFYFLCFTNSHWSDLFLIFISSPLYQYTLYILFFFRCFLFNYLTP